MQDCVEAQPESPLTNGGLVRYSKALRDTLRECNNDKAALREWAALLTKP